MMKTARAILAFGITTFAALAQSALAATIGKPALPYANPNVVASTYSVTHKASNLTQFSGPVGPGRRLHKDEILWSPVGPMNATAPMYSEPYPNGKRVIWVGGYDRVAKLDADTLQVLTTYAIGDNTYFGAEEIERHLATIDALSKQSNQAFVDYNVKFWPGLFKYAATFYRLLTRDNELFLTHIAADGKISIRVYGETDARDPVSPIVVKREWKIPPEISKATVFGMNITPDGRIVVATSDGTLIALSRDLTEHHVLKLPRKETSAASQDLFAAFMRNGIVTDDQGGVYVVTRDYLQRVQWTGSELSLDEVDGAWRAAYPNDAGIGSGTTPGLIGWGEKEDHLVVIADASKANGGNNMMVFWRDKIPEDWKGLPGFDRRVAGVTPIRFGVSQNEQVQIENGPVIYGDGVFFNNTYPVKRMKQIDGVTKQWLVDSFAMHLPGHEARGGTMIRWNAQARELKPAWQTQENLVSTVCTVSGTTETIYCWGSRNQEWTLEGIDWHTGKSSFHYTLGLSHRFNPMGVPIVIAPNGAADCGCTGGLGLVRVQPRELRRK